MSLPQRRRAVIVAAPAILVMAVSAGCARYMPSALPDRPDLRTSFAVLNPVKTAGGHHDSSGHALETRTLSMADVAIEAVMENPQLKAQRLKSGVGSAQIFSAGLLPDPQLAFSFAPVVAGPGTTTGWSYGLNYDFQSLVVRNAKVKVANATADRIDLEILWQEWQVVQQARTLCVTITTADRKLKVLHERQTLVQARFNKSNKALAAHTVTIETVGPDLTSLMDVNSQIAQLERTREDAHISLNALLGLHPNVDVRIATPAAPQPLSRDTIARATDSVMLRRPDLLALRAGYEAQEGQLQQAILAQFPSLNIGLAHAKDTTGVQTINVGVTLGLPLFNGNRGEIAVQAATRDQLRQEYQARVDQTVADVETLKRRQTLLVRQISSLRKEEPILSDMAKQAQAAYANGNITSLVLLNIESNLSQKRLERLDLEEALWTTRIALEASLALPSAAALERGGDF